MDRRSFLLGAASISLAGAVEAKIEREGAGSFPTLPKSVVYVKPLDTLRVVYEDCSWREDWVDTRLSLLWHPYEERLVGFQLRDAHWLCGKLLHSPMSYHVHNLLLIAMNELPGTTDERLDPYMRAMVLGLAEIPEDDLFYMIAPDQDLPIVLLGDAGPVSVQRVRKRAAEVLMRHCRCGQNRLLRHPEEPWGKKCPIHAYGGEWKIQVQGVGHDWLTNGMVPYPDNVLLLG